MRIPDRTIYALTAALLALALRLLGFVELAAFVLLATICLYGLATMAAEMDRQDADLLDARRRRAAALDAQLARVDRDRGRGRTFPSASTPKEPV
jgi:hypothetical protein